MIFLTSSPLPRRFVVRTTHRIFSRLLPYLLAAPSTMTADSVARSTGNLQQGDGMNMTSQLFGHLLIIAEDHAPNNMPEQTSISVSGMSAGKPMSQTSNLLPLTEIRQP